MALAIAAGHAAKGGNEIKAECPAEGGKPKTILKMLDEAELKIYSSLAESYATDPLQAFLPHFGGVVEEKLEDNEEQLRFIRISNLLYDFEDPKVMDIKIGVRTFLESECSSAKPRPDLYERMAKMYPSQLTDEERKAQSITKHRWMTTRDKFSTIADLGYRIDGIAGYRRKDRKEVSDMIAQFLTREDTLGAFIAFCDVAATDDGDQPIGRTLPATSTLKIAEEFQEQLRRLRAAIGNSPFVNAHEFIGTSLLLIADASGNAGVYWIDFAKTIPVADGMCISHEKAWQLGNHEDGIITGLDNIIQTFDDVILRLQDAAGYYSSVVVQKSFWLGPLPHELEAERQPKCCGFMRRKTNVRQESTSRTKMSDMALLSMIPSMGPIGDENMSVFQNGYCLGKKGVHDFAAAFTTAAEHAAQAGKVLRASVTNFSINQLITGESLESTAVVETATLDANQGNRTPESRLLAFPADLKDEVAEPVIDGFGLSTVCSI